MTATTISAFIHVSPDCDIDMKVNDEKKYAVLFIGDATIFINDHKQALEIASLLVQAAQELEDEDESN